MFSSSKIALKTAMIIILALTEQYDIPPDSTDISITRMLNQLKKQGVISDRLNEELEIIREATYTSQWSADNLAI